MLSKYELVCIRICRDSLSSPNLTNGLTRMLRSIPSVPLLTRETRMLHELITLWLSFDLLLKTIGSDKPFIDSTFISLRCYCDACFCNGTDIHNENSEPNFLLSCMFVIFLCLIWLLLLFCWWFY